MPMNSERQSTRSIEALLIFATFYLIKVGSNFKNVPPKRKRSFFWLVCFYFVYNIILLKKKLFSIYNIAALLWARMLL